VDGGLASNVPAQTVRDMGADIVIAVNVGADLADRTRLNSFAMVTKQVVDLMLHANVAESLREADVVITPDLTDFNSADFDKAAEIIPFGRAAAERVSEILKPYQLSATDYQTLTANRRINHGVVSPELDYIDLVNRSSVSNRWILANMETRTGRPLDLDILKKDLVWLFQTNEFTLIDFRLTRRSGEDGLEILTKEKPWGNDTFRFGMTLKDNFEGDSFYTLNMRYTNTRINSLGAEWRTDGQIGREGLFKTEFYQPLAHKTQYFAAVTAKYHRFYANQFEDGDKISDYRVYQYIGQVDTGVELGKYGELRTGVYYGRVNARLSTGKELESNRDIDIGGIAAQLVIDQIDDPGFPTEGYHLIAEYFGVMDALGGESDTQRVQFLYQNY
nr:BamA/TamA family outer membrane protein [bacterium]